MLSDEEKKAINDLNFIIVTDIYDNEVNIDKTKIINEYNKSVGIVLNLIEKQSKEIEELKGNDLRKDELVANMSTRHFNDREKIRKYEKLVDKIKAKIEESELLIDNSQGCMSDKDLYKEYGKIEFGQSLLEKE